MIPAGQNQHLIIHNPVKKQKKHACLRAFDKTPYFSPKYPETYPVLFPDGYAATR